MAKKVPRISRAPIVEKQPNIRKTPTPEKSPKALPQLRGGPLVWRFSAIDKAGPYAWTNLDADYKSVMETLHAFETMQETEIRSQGSHPVALKNLCKEATDRLKEIEKDDIDEIMSFRIKGKPRVWCVMNNNIMSVLWWDPDHQVCPSIKKHT